jgi:hypothetical protein
MSGAIEQAGPTIRFQSEIPTESAAEIVGDAVNAAIDMLLPPADARALAGGRRDAGGRCSGVESSRTANAGS